MTPPNPILTAALEYLALGWSVIPNCPPDHVGVGKRHAKDCDSRGKCPFFPLRQSSEWGRYQTERATEADVRGWWRHQGNLNVGVALGEVSKLAAVDIDAADGEELLLKLAGGNVPPTLEYATSRPSLLDRRIE